MSRPSRVRRLALLALLGAAGCQDYNFNPVGHCIVQPGAARVTLSDISTADVLFVVDDSGSMGGEQARLAASFKSFIENLDAFNQTRATDGLQPIDFHVAVTTTSVFLNNPSTALCKADCPNAAGTGDVCCRVSGTTLIGPLKQAKRCTGAADTACGTGNACTDACAGYLGEFVCCSATGAPLKTADVPCDTLDAACGDLQTHYLVDSTCQAGDAVNGGYYPHGAFIGAGQNPRVLHFDKSLYPLPTDPPCTGACVNRQGFTAAELRGFFEQNIAAGTCGSGEEQALSASQLAVEKAVAAEQLDTYPVDSRTYTPGTPAVWLHDASKLVVVYVGDEDDCSSPESATGGVILVGDPGADTCVGNPPLDGEKHKESGTADIVGYLTSLTLKDKTRRPVGAAFIVSTAQNSCQDEACTPGICTDASCTDGPQVCGGQAPGTRLLTAAAQFRSANGDVVVGSICDDFGPILDRIADIVKPPTGLILPTEPAASDIAVLRIAGADGKTRKTCVGPAPAGTSLADALAHPYDWWFTADRLQTTDAEKAPTGSTKYVFINHETKNCEASPGETYSADYLGRLPAGGCSGATAKEADDACAANLGGRGYTDTNTRDGDWTCYAGVDASGVCLQPTATNLGTCICGKRGGTDATPPLTDGNCPKGSAF